MSVLTGNDIRIKWRFVNKDYEEVDLTGVNDLHVLIQHARYDVTYEPANVNVVNGTIYFEIPQEDIKLPGVYHAHMRCKVASGSHGDGDKYVFVIFRGAVTISSTGGSCPDVHLQSPFCGGDESFQHLTILKARWGEIIGKIDDQEDLMVLFRQIKHFCNWGDLNGDITKQKDLRKYIIDLIKEYAPSGGDPDDPDDPDDPGTSYTFTVHVNDSTLGSVSPKTLKLDSGTGGAIQATAAQDCYIESWDAPDDVITTGIGKSTGEARIEAIRSNLSVTCNFARILDFTITPSTIELDSKGTGETGLSLKSSKGFTVTGGTLNGSAYNIQWGSDPADFITIGFANNGSGLYSLAVSSTANKSELRSKQITFKENETNKTSILSINQAKAVFYTVTASVEPTAAGTVTVTKGKTGEPEDGKWPDNFSGFKVKFTPNAGYGFRTENEGIFDVSDGQKRLLSVSNDYSTSQPVKRNYLLKVFASMENRFRLTTGTGGNGSGTIESISPSSADGFYSPGTVVTLRANNGNGANDFFDHWDVDGAIKNTQTITVTMNKDVNALAYFRYEPPAPPDRYYDVVLTAQPTEGGTVTGAGNYKEGSRVTVRATAKTDYEFSMWAGDISSFDREYTFNISKKITARAVFNRKPKPEYKLTLGKSIAAGGKVKVNGTESSGGTYAAGTKVTISAEAAQGYQFTEWSGLSQAWNLQNPVEITMNSDYNITANFKNVSMIVTARFEAIQGGGEPGYVWPQNEVVLASAYIQGNINRPLFGGTYHLGDATDYGTGNFVPGTDTYVEYEVRLPYTKFGNGTTTAFQWKRPNIHMQNHTPTSSLDQGREGGENVGGGEVRLKYKVNIPTNNITELKISVYWIDPYARQE